MQWICDSLPQYDGDSGRAFLVCYIDDHVLVTIANALFDRPPMSRQLAERFDAYMEQDLQCDDESELPVKDGELSQWLQQCRDYKLWTFRGFEGAGEENICPSQVIGWTIITPPANTSTIVSNTAID